VAGNSLSSAPGFSAGTRAISTLAFHECRMAGRRSAHPYGGWHSFGAALPAANRAPVFTQFYPAQMSCQSPALLSFSWRPQIE
jgi:hypothetical protein